MRFSVIIILTLLLSTGLQAKKKGAPPMTSGAPGDRTCQTSKCHAGNELNSDKATIQIEGLPSTYTPNEIYEITLHLQQDGAKKFGFQASVADEEGNGLGTLIAIDEDNTRILSNERYKTRTSRQYLTHTTKGIGAIKKGESQTWKMQWKAPETAEATSSFYFALNAANGNKKKTGDYIYTRTIDIKPTLK